MSSGRKISVLNILKGTKSHFIICSFLDHTQGLFIICCLLDLNLCVSYSPHCCDQIPHRGNWGWGNRSGLFSKINQIHRITASKEIVHQGSWSLQWSHLIWCWLAGRTLKQMSPSRPSLSDPLPEGRLQSWRLPISQYSTLSYPSWVSVDKSIFKL